MRSNNVNLIGNIGNEVKLVETPTGKKVLKLSIAENITSGSGENKKTRTIWHKVVLWEKSAELHAKHIQKGDKITLLNGNLDYEIREIEGQKVLQAFIVNPQIFYSKK